MASELQHLFQEFPEISKAEWIAKIEKDLKGKPLSILDYQPELGIETRAYFHKDDHIQTNQMEIFDSNDWFIQENFSALDNKKILEHLQIGCDAIQLDVDDSTNFKNLLSGVELAYISTEFRYKDTANWNNLNTYLSNQQTANVCVSFPVLTNGILNGNFKNSLDEFKTFRQALTTSGARTIHIDGFTFGLAGASTIQELAICLAQLSEYTQNLMNDGVGLEEIAESFYSTLSVNDEYFTNIAKFRAYQILLGHFFTSFDEHFVLDNTVVNGQTNYRHITKNDRYNNLLRSTTQAMSAILGGCANLQITPFDKNDPISERMARNIQLVIKEEAYFDKVNDPAHGSYYIEDLTNQLVEKSWDLFLDIENHGGYISCIQSNYIQHIIQKNKDLLINNLNSNTKMFLGINTYHNTLENWITITPDQEQPNGVFNPLTPFILENHYTKPTE